MERCVASSEKSYSLESYAGHAKLYSDLGIALERFRRMARGEITPDESHRNRIYDELGSAVSRYQRFVPENVRIELSRKDDGTLTTDLGEIARFELDKHMSVMLK